MLKLTQKFYKKLKLKNSQLKLKKVEVKMEKSQIKVNNVKRKILKKVKFKTKIQKSQN